MHRLKVKSCCSYGDPEFCIQVVVSVLLHHGPEFVLTVLRSSIEHIAAQLIEGSPMRSQFTGLAAQLAALVAKSAGPRAAKRDLN